MLNYKLNKRGLSPVIATVLLVLIVLVLIAIVAIFVLPGLTTNVREKSACFDAINKMNFDDSGYNCYFSKDSKDRTAFAINIRSPDILGFRVGLISQGTSDTFDIKNGTQTGSLRMYDQDSFGLPLEVVNDGGVRTYVADGLYQSIDIFPILSFEDGYVCKSTRKSLNLGQCLDANIKNNIDDDDDNPDDPKCGDGVCNNGEDTNTCTQDCGGNQECTLTSASWSKTSSWEGEQVNLIVSGENCNGKTVSFAVWEDDVWPFPDASASMQPIDVVFNGNTATGTWTSEFKSDVNNPPEYYFVASSDGKQVTSSNPELNVYTCGDLLVNSPEECDGSLNGQTCQTKGFKSGTLVCNSPEPGNNPGPNECKFNTNGCSNNEICGDGNDECNNPGGNKACTIGGYNGQQLCKQDCTLGQCIPTEYCGDNIKNDGETCDGDSKTCKVGNYNGHMACKNDCSGYNNCLADEWCGDGIPNGGEECDHGAQNGQDGQCDASCHNIVGGQVCPNGELEYPETCDDGNNNAGDGCYLCQIEGNSSDGGPWHCSGGLEKKSICCNDITGQCTGGNNYGGKNYDPGQETNDGCLGPNTPGSCAYTFGNLFGWKDEPGVKCSLGLGWCSSWKDQCPDNSGCKKGGDIYGYAMGVCCYKKGICEITWDPCFCTGD